MRKSMLTLLMVLTWLPWSIGCSGEDEAEAPKSKEEIRKEYIDRSERMRKENP